MSFDFLIQITEDIYQVRLPLPFALRIVNCYLIQDDDGWAILDTGINIPEARAVWESVFQQLGIRQRDLKRIFLTHVHPDHFGLAGWLQYWADADIPIYTSTIEQNIANRVWFSEQNHEQIFEHLRFGGLRDDFLKAVHESYIDTLNMTYPHPSLLYTLDAGETLRIGARTFRTWHGGGHSDGQLLFYDREDQLMLCGDQVLMGITPNIGLWTNADPYPLRHFLESMEVLQDLPVRLALAGHKANITDWSGRIQELMQHHELRLNTTRMALQSGAQSAFEVAHHLFDVKHFTVHEWRFAIAEALAHLEHLHEQDEIIRRDEHIWRYSLV